MEKEILKRPLITEKGVQAQETVNRYAFEVLVTANKPSIKRAVEELFGVKVKDVHTMIQHGKSRRVGRYTGRHPNWKKAVVTLAEGQKIPLFEAK